MGDYPLLDTQLADSARLFDMEYDETNQMTSRDLLLKHVSRQRSCVQSVSCREALARWRRKCPRCGEKLTDFKPRPFHYLCKSGKQRPFPKAGEVVTCNKLTAIDSA